MADLTARTQPAKPDCSRATSLTDRITEIVDDHTPTGSSPNITCWCDVKFVGYRAHAAHVADLITTAAEEHYRPRVETVAETMRQEWGVGYRKFDRIENVIPREGRTDAEILNMEYRYSDHQGYSVVSRHVTEWVVWSPGAGE